MVSLHLLKCKEKETFPPSHVCPSVWMCWFSCVCVFPNKVTHMNTNWRFEQTWWNKSNEEFYLLKSTVQLSFTSHSQLSSQQSWNLFWKQTSVFLLSQKSQKTSEMGQIEGAELIWLDSFIKILHRVEEVYCIGWRSNSWCSEVNCQCVWSL